jgi:hypothetical protein
VKYFRIYTDEEGETHFEDVDIQMEDQNPQSALSMMYPAIGIMFRRTPADQFIDWHPAPRRQFVITLSGEAEVEASDGEVRQIGPGTIMLAEDLTGKGHITRGIGAEERISLFIPLHEQGEGW